MLCAFCALAPSFAFSDEATASREELVLAPGMEGMISSWLVLGPMAAPPMVKRSEEGVGGWDPIDAAEMGEGPEEGRRESGKVWTARLTRESRVKLKGRGPSVAYLAVRLRSDEPRKLHLSTGSNAGMDVWLGGELILGRDEGGPSGVDSHLVPLAIPAGDSLLVVRLWKTRKGIWSFRARLMDEQFRRPRGLFVVLGGVEEGVDSALDLASLRISREILPESSALQTRFWLEFRGGRPTAGVLPVKVRTLGPQGESFDPIDLSFSTSGLAFDLLGNRVYTGERCPGTVQITLGKNKKLEAPLSVRMRDVRSIGEATTLMGGVSPGDLPKTSVESVRWRVEHLRELVEAGDRDWKYIGREAADTLRMARALSKGRDPYADARGGIQRRGYRSGVDGKLHHYALYVPPGWRESGDRSFGLIVSLHGLNSSPIKALTSLMGFPLEDDESKQKRERHPPKVGPAPMFAVAPDGFGNSGYVAFGERDVEEVIQRVSERYRIDPDRIYITGASMGGIGSASVPLHRPDRFAAAAPLCGYHSLFEYGSLRGVELHPWERFLAEFRSNARWAAHGRHLPLHIVHGTRDGLRHSLSLVEAYRLKGFDVTFETPDAGHNVWDETYDKKRIFKHFGKYRRKAHPRKVTVETSRLRYDRAHWLVLDGVLDHGVWARLKGHWKEEGVIEVSSVNASGFTVLRDEKLAGDKEVSFTIDGAPVEVSAQGDGKWSFHREGDTWKAGAVAKCEDLCKRSEFAGPIDDVYYEPLLFVYGTADPNETALARRLIGKLKHPRLGVTVDWPVEADVEVSEEDVENYSLVLVGTPSGNSILARIAGDLPIGVEEGAVVVGDRRHEGESVAVSFVYPNPLNPDRYVMVHTGVTSRALFYAGHLPQLLPDWVVYDGSDWTRSRGLVLKDREILDAGFFDESWKLVSEDQKP